jgi:uncharacterized SAM-binding protein YcdF (DUF218 family)
MDYRDVEAGGEGGAPRHTDELGLPESIDRAKKKRRPGFFVWKWIFYILVLVYFIVSAYRSPLLVTLGEYLIVEHEPKKADLIVCLGASGVVNFLGAIDAYKKGLAPYIFRVREVEPDGLDYLKRRIETYPTNFDLFTIAVRGFEIPEEVILSADERVGSTIEEARLVHRFALERKFNSIILVTSLTHSRRAYLTFKKVFKDDAVTIISLPSHYQLFDPKDWWKKRRYTKELIIEYQKLIYYKLKYLI